MFGKPYCVSDKMSIDTQEKEGIMKLKTAWNTVILTLVLALGAGLQASERQRAAQIRLEGKTPIIWSDCNDVQIVALVDNLAAHHQYVQAITGAEIALAHGLKGDQDAFLRLRMAQCYEALENGGPLARQRYAEVVALHPDYPRNVEICLRLGELYDHIILPGTEPNLTVAKKYYARAAESHGQSSSKAIWLPVLQAHIHLGNLYARTGEYTKSNEYYEFIYACDPNLVTPLPYDAFESQEEADAAELTLRGKAAHLKDVVRKHLVSNCIRPDLATSLKELDALAEKHRTDPAIVQDSTTQRKRLIDRTTEINKALENSVNGSVGDK